MVDSTANFLLETLRDLLIEEVKFLSGVAAEVKNAETDLRTIHGLLMEADANKPRNDSRLFKDCINQLKKLAFDAESVLEKYDFEVESKRQAKGLKKKFQRFMGILCECYRVHEVGNEITNIRSRLADLTVELRSITRGGEGSSSSDQQQQRRLLRLRYAHEVEQHFVGMDKDINSVVLMVKDETPRSASVISICGMGGLGKTTLARKIYHHEDIKGKFDCVAWVCVTQQFEAKSILREILQQVGGSRLEVEVAELVGKLHNVLLQKKCLIMIDDIWENDHWNIIKPAFPKENCRVVLTTRNEKIASHESCHLYRLGFLSRDEGWELLRKMALQIHDDQTQVLESRLKQFEEIGKQIVQKCGYLPLVISIIGGILRQKQPILAEWEEVSRNMDTYLRHGGEGIENDNRVKQILDLSFDALPYYLKPCFLYLACFAEDYEISTEQLYLLWMAEGLISSEEKGNHETLRDVAERYLAELAFRCMVQVKKNTFNIPHEKSMLNNPYNKFKSCRLHDLMRDLCSSKAEEEKFMKYADLSSFTGALTDRLAINLGKDDLSAGNKNCLQEVKDLRSFLLVSTKLFSTTNYQNTLNFENSKQMRILLFQKISFEDEDLPSTIGKLIHLKYLGLYYCKVKELPRHICDLPYLQTLVLLTYNGSTLKLPNYIWKMKRLRHLFLPPAIEVIGGGKLKLDGLYELETLTQINSKNSCIEDIVTIKNLRKLEVSIVEDEDCLTKIVDYMSNNGCQLRETYLTIVACELSSVVKKMLMIRSLVHLIMKECVTGRSFPLYIQGMCHNLITVSISYSKIDGDLLEVFGKLPHLQLLSLDHVSGEMVTEMRFDATSFPELGILYLFSLENLYKWEVKRGAMAKLTELYIVDCENLKKLPDGLRFISTLERLTCSRMSEEFNARWRTGENGEEGDYDNFSHVPHKYIY